MLVVAKAKVDVDMGDGVHITVSAEGASQGEALELAYKRAMAIVEWAKAVDGGGDRG